MAMLSRYVFKSVLVEIDLPEGVDAFRQQGVSWISRRRKILGPAQEKAGISAQGDQPENYSIFLGTFGYLAVV
jgi:hypothetical protein